MKTASRWAVVLLATLPAAGAARAQTTERVSVDSGGAQANAGSGLASISADGRFVAFESDATNFVPDTNQSADVFVRDRQLGTTERVSLGAGGTEANGSSYSSSISSDGRFVAFASMASNLVANDTNGYDDVFVHDRQTGTTERVSLGAGGVQGNGTSTTPSISADGRFVAFRSSASNFPGGSALWWNVFVRDRQTGTTTCVSVSSSGAGGNSNSWDPSISADGRFVAYWSDATNLFSNDTNAHADVLVRDRQTQTTECASLDSGGLLANNGGLWPSISADGRCVAFTSNATNLVAGDTNGWADVFVRDRQLGTTVRVSVDTAGVEGNGECGRGAISADGSAVAFGSNASNLVTGDTNAAYDIFLHVLPLGTTERVSTDSSGLGGDAGSGFYGTSLTLSAHGRHVSFWSYATNLVAGDTNGFTDTFVRDRGPGNPGTDLCQAGSGGVIACPCANPPANAPRGCDNSAATGGAQLTSSGWASLAFDSLVFATNGEKPTATSVVLQGNAEAVGGLAFGQGVRCVGGGLKRLYVKTASSGSITAPLPGDPSVSARSAALGDTITAGTNRWYAVYYRDPIVLGGCSATSTFNITQTQLVAWSP